jgi:hypothetical protein
MSRFYDPRTGIPQLTVPTADGTKLRSVNIGDAKRNGWVASVSTICGLVKESDALTSWKVNLHLEAAHSIPPMKNLQSWKGAVREAAEKEMNKAPKLGSEVHAAIEHYHRIRASHGDLKQLKDNHPDHTTAYLAAIHSFCTKHNIRALSKDDVERRVVVPEARSAGTLDFVGSFGEKPLVLLDWKTQNVRKAPYYYIAFPLQLAAYWAGLGKKGAICSVIIDTSGKDTYSVEEGRLPEISYKFYESPLAYYQHFLALSKLYYLINEWEEPISGE